MSEVRSPPADQVALCVVCGLKLSSDDDPQLLPCLHSICIHCFTSPKESPECPVCREKYDLKEIIRNLLLAKSTLNPEETRCSGCHEASASGWCVDCQENLCSVCVAAHQRVKVAREHYIHTVTAESPRPVMCPVHKQDVISSFCLTCEQLTCRCCRPLHPNHLLQVSHEAVGKQRKQIRRMVQKVQQKKFGVQKKLRDLKGRLTDLQDLEERVQMEVKQIMVKLYNVLIKKAAKIIRKVKNRCRKERELITDRWTLLQRLDQKHNHVLTFTDQVLASLDHIVLLSCKKQIRQQLQGLLDQTDLPLSTMMELHFQSNEASVKKALKAFGHVMTMEVPFSCSSTESNPDLRTNSTTIQTPPRDNNQDPVSAFPPIRARLYSQDEMRSGTRLKRAWSYCPYQPKGAPQLKQPSIKPSGVEQVGRSQLPVTPSFHNRPDPDPWEIPPAEPLPPIPLVTPTLKNLPSVPPILFLLQTPHDPPTQSPSDATPPNMDLVDPGLEAPPSGCDGDRCNMDTSPQVSLFSRAFPDRTNLSQQDTSLAKSTMWKPSDLLSGSRTGRHVGPISATIAPFRVVNPKPLSEVRLLSALPQSAADSADSAGLLEAENSPINLSKCYQEKSDGDAQVTDTAQIFTQTKRRIKEEIPAVNVMSPSIYCFPLEQQEDEDKEDEPVIKLRDEQGNLGSLGSLGRDWLPDVSVHRLSLPDHPSSDPGTYRLIPRERGEGFEIRAVQTDPQGVDANASCPLLAKKPYCAACRVSGKLLHCSVCQRAFHRECHFPPVSLPDSCSSSLWRCTLCQDLTRPEHLDVDPEAFGPPGLGPSDQRKCEFLLLSLICHKHSSMLYGSVKLSSPTPRYVDMILIQGRLLRKLSPPYHTSTEFISDLWLLLNMLLNSPKEAQHVKRLQRFFSQELGRVFGQNLPLSLLTDPYGAKIVGQQ